MNRRLESLLLELERELLSLIICQQGVGRSILAYYLHKNNSALSLRSFIARLLVFAVSCSLSSAHCLVFG